ncbi:MAG TPA: hypothetical protein VF808_00015 [Ktedonobacterales bacterium]
MAKLTNRASLAHLRTRLERLERHRRRSGMTGVIGQRPCSLPPRRGRRWPFWSRVGALYETDANHNDPDHVIWNPVGYL